MWNKGKQTCAVLNLFLSQAHTQECADSLSQGVTEDLIGLCMFVKLDRSLTSEEEANGTLRHEAW